MGKIQLSGKLCTYEIDSRDNTEECILTALKDGFTPTQKQRWEKHVTQLIKYYLYALTDQTAHLIGRGVDDSAKFIMTCFS